MGAVIEAELVGERSVGSSDRTGPSWWRRNARPVLFWTHLVAGLVSGVVVLIMSVTGVLLTYQKQMTSWADLRGLAGGPPAAGATRLSADSLLRRLRSDSALTPTSIVWRNNASAPVEMVLPQQRRLFVNGYTGHVLGSGSADMRKFFRVVTDWHRWLAMSGERRDTGRMITGASNLAFLLLVLTGIWLWWPRNATRVAFRSVMRFRGGLSSKARDFNWHHVIGFWSFIPLAIIVASGVVISYPWASDLVYRVAGEAPPRREAAPTPPAGPRNEAARPPVISIDAALATATARVSDWRTISLTLPRNDTAALAFTIDRGMGGEPTKRAQLALASDGTERRWQPFESQSTARRWRSILRFAHTGEVLGFAGQTIAGLLSLGATLLVYTGLALSWRRFWAWRRRAALRAGAP